MNRKIDCLLIGHNEMQFHRYEEYIAKMGMDSGAYRDLNLSILWSDGKPFHLAGMYNHLAGQDLGMGEAFSATISYLGSFLDRHGSSFDYIQSFQDEQDRLAEILSTDTVLTVAITTTYYMFVLPILEIVNFVRKHNRDVKIIVGGPYISGICRTQPDHVKENLFANVMGADIYVNSSQGEATLVSLIQQLRENRGIEEVPNLYFMRDGQLVRTKTEREANDISQNPVNWSLFQDHTGHSVNMRTSISCPFRCSFCGFPQHAGDYQTSATEVIAGEFAALQAMDGIRCVNIIDDTFNVPMERFKEILRMMIDKGFDFDWICNLRCQFLDEESALLMKQAGCAGVFLGIESGSLEILQNMNKKATVAQYRRGIEYLRKAGILTFGSFIVGFPGETKLTAQETIDFILNSGIDYYRVHLWYCDPITPIWQQREQFGISGEGFSWSHNTMTCDEAGVIIDHIFKTVRQPVWIPQYNFDFDSLWHLLYRGMDMDSIRTFLSTFNEGVAERLENPAGRDVRTGILERMSRCLPKGGGQEEQAEQQSFGVDFDF
jgi:radical SAM PhpK family P-methyltransferase